jgi:phosphonopyruvate decarboxylase
MTPSSAVQTQAISPTDFFARLKAEEIGPFVGVPCSLISSLIAYAVDHAQEVEYLNPTHESHAMAFGAGSYMATGKLPMVFMQNSGFGNIINPLTSLHQIYDIPALLLVTWRAEEGYGTDAPEHWIVGEHMEEYFRTFQLPYRMLTPQSWQRDILDMKEEALRTKKPAVLCVKKGLFAPYSTVAVAGKDYAMTSAQALTIIKSALKGSVFLSTTGMLSRESFTVEDTPDFYMMGSMGLIGGIAAGCARYSNRRVVAVDGDGAVMMHMGLLPFIGAQKYKNFFHIVIDNEAYSSTQGQPTVSPSVDFVLAAKACGYARGVRVETEQALAAALKDLADSPGPTMLHVKVRSGNDHHIGRVSDKYTCPEVTERFSKNFS